MFVLPTVTGREWSDWSSELRIPGDELKWKFISDGSVNGWGWRFTVYPIMPAAGKAAMQHLQEGKSRFYYLLFYTALIAWYLHAKFQQFICIYTKEIVSFILRKHFRLSPERCICT